MVLTPPSRACHPNDQGLPHEALPFKMPTTSRGTTKWRPSLKYTDHWGTPFSTPTLLLRLQIHFQENMSEARNICFCVLALFTGCHQSVVAARINEILNQRRTKTEIKHLNQTNSSVQATAQRYHARCVVCDLHKGLFSCMGQRYLLLMVSPEVRVHMTSHVQVSKVHYIGFYRL